MKKQKINFLLALIALTSLSFSSMDVKAQSFEMGDVDLNVQLGLGSTWYLGTYYSQVLPYISVSGDYALIDKWGPGIFGVGAIVGVVRYKWDWIYDDLKYTYFSFAPRATYHYQFVDKLDTYAGLVTGVEFVVVNDANSTYKENTGVNPIFSAFAGVKYYFTDNIAVMSEIYAYDIATFNAGICFKF